MKIQEKYEIDKPANHWPYSEQNSEDSQKNPQNELSATKLLISKIQNDTPKKFQ